MTVDEAIKELTQAIRGSGLRCSEFKALISELGFALKKRRRGNHWTYMHPDLSDFHGAGFDCGHGKNLVVKTAYLQNARTIIRKFESELRELRGENDV